MFDRKLTLDRVDPAVWAAIQQEDTRQEQHIELIASENYASPAVMQAQGTQMTNKYAEGYPGKRYYGGCEYVDIVEQLAIDRLKALFGAEAANVQPNSGSQANQAVYLACLKPGDSVLGMSLAEGGHLTHGASVNASGKLYNFHQYGLDANEVLDYAKVEQLALVGVQLARRPGDAARGFLQRRQLGRGVREREGVHGALERAKVLRVARRRRVRSRYRCGVRKKHRRTAR